MECFSYINQIVYIASWMNGALTRGESQAVGYFLSTDEYILQSPVSTFQSEKHSLNKCYRPDPSLLACMTWNRGSSMEDSKDRLVHTSPILLLVQRREGGAGHSVWHKTIFMAIESDHQPGPLFYIRVNYFYQRLQMTSSASLREEVKYLAI